MIGLCKSVSLPLIADDPVGGVERVGLLGGATVIGDLHLGTGDQPEDERNAQTGPGVQGSGLR